MALDPATREAILRAAREQGIDPSLALAVGERESNFDPNAKSSKTIRGIYQMTGTARAQSGVGDSKDPYTQASGWGSYMKDVKREMSGPLGRQPTDTESYLGHYFGGVRAGKVLKMDPSTPVQDVFTPNEMAGNPNFARAGTIGQLRSSIMADIDKRRAKYGGEVGDAPAPDPSSGGSPVGQAEPAPATPGTPPTPPTPPMQTASADQATTDAADDAAADAADDAPAKGGGANSFKGIPNLDQFQTPLQHLYRLPNPSAQAQVGNVAPMVPGAAAGTGGIPGGGAIPPEPGATQASDNKYGYLSPSDIAV